MSKMHSGWFSYKTSVIIGVVFKLTNLIWLQPSLLIIIEVASAVNAKYELGYNVQHNSSCILEH